MDESYQADEAPQVSSVDFGTTVDFGWSTEGEARMNKTRAEGEAELQAGHSTREERC